MKPSAAREPARTSEAVRARSQSSAGSMWRATWPLCTLCILTPIPRPRSPLALASPTATSRGAPDVLYQWLVFVHLAGLVIFLMGHGVAVGCAFRVRSARDRTVMTRLRDLSAKGSGFGWIGLILLAVGGLGAAWNANQLSVSWVIGSYVVLIAVLLGMFIVASPFYYGLRDAIAGAKGATPIGDEELVARLQNRRPEILLAIGGIGLLLLVWLMVLK